MILTMFDSGMEDRKILEGMPRKIVKSLTGTPRDLISWSDNSTFKRAMFGTEAKLYEFHGDSLFDITPIRGLTSTGDNTLAIVTIDGTNSGFSTESGSIRVSVSASSHGAETGDFVTFSSATTIGGTIDLQSRTYEVSVLNVDKFSFDASVTANATQTGVGTATAQFYLRTGTSVATQGLGYGAGIYDAGVSSTGERAWSDPATSSAIVFRNTQWTLDNWGEDVVACRREGRIYTWDTSQGTATRAALISASPTVNNYVIVSPNDRHLISLGSTEFSTGIYNAMLVRWADQMILLILLLPISSTSGENILTDGSEIVGAVRFSYCYQCLDR